MKTIKQFINENVFTEHNVMEEYFDIKSNTHSPSIINEETVNRILDKHAKHGFVIVSANRSDKDKKTNNENAKKCIAKIRKSGYSYFPVYGGYHDKDNNVKDSYELSFFITNFKGKEAQEDFEPLKKLAIELCKDFDQDSVLVTEPNGKPQYIDRDGKVVGKDDGGVTSINRIEKEFFTALYKKTDGTNRFTYSMEFEMCVNPQPCTLNERYRRTQNCEIIL